jgi:hypothetical protein
MRREHLEHLVKAAADLADDSEIVVVGSQAILAQFPDAPAALLVSIEADLYPRNQPERAIDIDAVIGEGSRFSETYGYYAQGVGPETPKAPAGWEERLVAVELPAFRPRGAVVTAWCMEAHDIVLSKLAAGREKDIAFAREAVRAGLVDRDRLTRAVEQVPSTHRRATRERLAIVLARLDAGRPP